MLEIVSIENMLQVKISDLYEEDDGNVFLLRDLSEDCKLDDTAITVPGCEGKNFYPS